MTSLSTTLQALSQLGAYLTSESEELTAAAQQAERHNPWFNQQNIKQSFEAIGNEYLNSERLAAWASTAEQPTHPKSVGIIMAGNIPLVGFHDLLAVLVSGNRALIKTSSKDNILMLHIINKLKTLEPTLSDRIQVIERLQDFDAVIATGSNNSARYFEQYFSKYPNIIRKNRNGVAVLTGEETDEELFQLGHDVFDYFGLGCRNVSKLFVPQGYDFNPLMAALDKHKEVIQNNKYKNNFDYNLTLLLLNKVPHFVNDCVMVSEDESLHSRIASLHYQVYENAQEAYEWLEKEEANIQCVVDGKDIAFGGSQRPSLTDYADNVDTLKFLSTLTK